MLTKHILTTGNSELFYLYISSTLCLLVKNKTKQNAHRNNKKTDDLFLRQKDGNFQLSINKISTIKYLCFCTYPDSPKVASKAASSIN